MGYTTVLTSNIQGEETVEEYVESFPNSGTWFLNGNTLTFTIDGVSTDYEIVSFSDGIMKWKQEIDETVDAVGIPVTTKATYDLELEKQ